VKATTSAGWTGPEPAASGVTGEASGVTGVSNDAQGIDNVRLRQLAAVQNSQAFAPNHQNLLTTFLQGFMTVAEVAKHFGVSRSTVYKLCERGELRHLRVSNAIRIGVPAVAQFWRRRSD
jgi:excisionase family DNA binding protein